LTDWLSVRGSLGLDNLSMRSRGFDSPAFGPWAAQGGQAQAGHTYANKVTYEGTLSFNRSFGDMHEVSGVVGSSYEDNTEEWSWVQGTQFPTEYFKYITSAATIADGSSTRDENALLSFFGRLSYTYADKITTTFNIRRDGSSRFGSANRFGTFPSASILYRIGEEDFMQNQNVIHDLALRASYGVTGSQQALGNFAARRLGGGRTGGGRRQLRGPGRHLAPAAGQPRAEVGEDGAAQPRHRLLAAEPARRHHIRLLPEEDGGPADRAAGPAYDGLRGHLVERRQHGERGRRARSQPAAGAVE